MRLPLYSMHTIVHSLNSLMLSSIFWSGFCSGLNLNAFHGARIAPPHLQPCAPAGGAKRHQWDMHLELAATLPTLRRARHTAEMKLCSFGESLLAQDVKVELDRIIHKAAEFAYDDFD